MKKVFEHMDFPQVGLRQSMLENEGIRTELRNMGASIAVGEIPFHEVWPELWVINDEDYARAMDVLKDYKPPETEGVTDWVCLKCKEEVEKEFGECWNCGTIRPEDKNEAKLPPKL